MQLRSLTTAPNLHGSVVLVRAPLNVPLENGVVRNHYRLTHTLPTLRYLQQAGARTVVLGHIGREPTESLRPVAEALGKSIDLTFADTIDPAALAPQVDALLPGQILLAENLRQDARERANDPDFAAALAALADVYVNDAFAVMHREHASMVGIPRHLPAYAGLRVIDEVAALAAAQTPAQPSLFILGGAKFETKLALVEQYLGVYDELFIGGALAHDVLRARGYEIGRSLVSDVSLVDAPYINDPRLTVPEDVVVKRLDGSTTTLAITDVEVTDTILDAGVQTTTRLAQQVAAAATVLWNGPLGNYEAGFTAGTEALATALADSDAASYVGGGDTVAAIESLERSDDFTFISTGGGAMLAYLEHGDLPALSCLRAE